jgi:3-hydroxyisobutyrate dehydrogenase-like beta-hydroxyacid dehydrogenase
MGSAIASCLLESGHRVVTCTGGRSEQTVGLARKCGVEVLSNLAEVVAASHVLISLVPPAASVELAESVVASHPAPGMVFVDANSGSPEQIDQIEQLMGSAGAELVDASIHGGAHRLREIGVIYLSGKAAEVVEQIFNSVLRVRTLGSSPGIATRMKVLLGGVSKGLNALFLEVGSIACRDGMLDSFLDECQAFYPAVMEAVDRMLPTYPRHAERRVSELEHVERLASDHGLDAGMTRQATGWIGGISRMDWQEAEYTTKEVIEAVARFTSAES